MSDSKNTKGDKVSSYDHNQLTMKNASISLL